MLKYIILSISIISFICLLLIFNYSTPYSMGPLGVLLTFFLIYLLSFSLITVFILVFVKVFSFIFHAIWHKQIMPLSLKKSAIYSSIIATAPAMILALSSVGAANWYGYLLVAIFIIIGCLYISRRIP